MSNAVEGVVWTVLFTAFLGIYQNFWGNSRVDAREIVSAISLCGGTDKVDYIDLTIGDSVVCNDGRELWISGGYPKKNGEK